VVLAIIIWASMHRSLAASDAGRRATAPDDERQLRTTNDRGGRRTIMRVLFALGLLMVIVAIWSLATGGATMKLLGASISTTRPFKVFTTATWLLAIALLLHPRVTRALASRSVVLFYAVAAAVMFVLALGPFPHAFGAQIFYQAPYALLMRLPGGDSLRVPARFGMLVALCLSQLAAMSFMRLSSARPRATLVALVLAGLIAIDGWVPAMKADAVPGPIDLSGLDASTPVLELPIWHIWDDTRAMLRSMIHRHPLVNGYSGYAPEEYIAFEAALRKTGPIALRRIDHIRPLIIVVDHDHDADAKFRKYLDAMPGATNVREADDVTVYLLK
jgi:hypothetical protein